MTDSPTSRLHALGDELVAIHHDLRQKLRHFRENPHPADGRRDLRVHCLAFCEALTRHHTSEDRTAFPILAAEYPELRPVLEKLEEDHLLITGILGNVERIVTELPAAPTPDELRHFERELDGLAAIMDSHFAFEERRMVTALNDLGDPGLSPAHLFGAGRPSDGSTE